MAVAAVAVVVAMVVVVDSGMLFDEFENGRRDGAFRSLDDITWWWRWMMECCFC